MLASTIHTNYNHRGKKFSQLKYDYLMDTFWLQLLFMRHSVCEFLCFAWPRPVTLSSYPSPPTPLTLQIYCTHVQHNFKLLPQTVFSCCICCQVPFTLRSGPNPHTLAGCLPATRVASFCTYVCTYILVCDGCIYINPRQGNKSDPASWLTVQFMLPLRRQLPYRLRLRLHLRHQQRRWWGLREVGCQAGIAR